MPGPRAARREACDAGLVPAGERLTVLVDAILPFAGGLEVVGPERFHADEHLGAPGARGLLDEARQTCGGRVHLHHEIHRHTLVAAKRDEGVEDGLP